MIGGHAHLFDLKQFNEGNLDDVPIIVAPGVSPLAGNNPAYMTLDFHDSG